VKERKSVLVAKKKIKSRQEEEGVHNHETP